jgi:hypothetical protein
MQLIRSEVTIECNGSVPRDMAVNTVYHTAQTSLIDPATDWMNHANEVRDAFIGATGDDPLFVYYKTRRVTVKVYDMADPLPRPEKAVSMYTPGTSSWDTEDKLSPPQVALCLSFYGDQNTKNKRGRIYIGPFAGFSASAGLILNARPTLAMMQNILQLGHALFDVGGENIAHVIHHGLSKDFPTTPPAPTVVQNYWVDDRWDTIRGRLSKATSRQTLAP